MLSPSDMYLYSFPRPFQQGPPTLLLSPPAQCLCSSPDPFQYSHTCLCVPAGLAGSLLACPAAAPAGDVPQSARPPELLPAAAALLAARRAEGHDSAAVSLQCLPGKKACIMGLQGSHKERMQRFAVMWTAQLHALEQTKFTALPPLILSCCLAAWSQVCAVLRSLAQLDTNEWANPRHVSAQAELVRALAARRELHTEIIDLLPPINLHALHPSVKPKQQSRSPGVRVGNKEVAPNSLQPGLHASGASLSRAKSDEASSPAPPASSTTTATSSTRSRSAAPVPLRRRMMLLPASGTRVRPLQRRMQERDVRLGLWLLTHLQVGGGCGCSHTDGVVAPHGSRT
eukprot:504023-Pelagomonas_calceolata.AAC.5